MLMKSTLLLAVALAAVTQSVSFAQDRTPSTQEKTPSSETLKLPAIAPANAKVGDTYETLTLKDGKVLKKVKVTHIEPDGIRVSHADGVSRISYTHMSDDLLT